MFCVYLILLSCLLFITVALSHFIPPTDKQAAKIKLTECSQLPPLPLQTAFTSFSPWFVLTHLSDLQRFIFFFLLSGFEQIEAADYLNAIGAMWAAYTQTFISVSCPCLDFAGANKWVFKRRRWDMGLHTQQVPLCSANTWQNFWLLFCFVFAEFVVDTECW